MAAEADETPMTCLLVFRRRDLETWPDELPVGELVDAERGGALAADVLAFFGSEGGDLDGDGAGGGGDVESEVGDVGAGVVDNDEADGEFAAGLFGHAESGELDVFRERVLDVLSEGDDGLGFGERSRGRSGLFLGTGGENEHQSEQAGSRHDAPDYRG